MSDLIINNLPNEYFPGLKDDAPIQLNRLLIAPGSENDVGSLVLKGHTVMTLGHSDDGLNLKHPILKVGGRSDLYSVSISTYKNDCIIGRNDNYHYSNKNLNKDQLGSLLIRSRGRYNSDGINKELEGLEVYHGTKLTTLDESGYNIFSNINSEYYPDRQHRLSYTYDNNTKKTHMTNISDFVNIHSDIRTIISVGEGDDENNLEDLHSYISLSKATDQEDSKMEISCEICNIVGKEKLKITTKDYQREAQELLETISIPGIDCTTIIHLKNDSVNYKSCNFNTIIRDQILLDNSIDPSGNDPSGNETNRIVMNLLGDGKYVNLPNINVPQIKLTSNLIDINGSVQTKDNLIIGDRTGINYRFTTKKRSSDGDDNTYYLTIDKYNGENNLGSVCDFDMDNDGEDFIYD